MPDAVLTHVEITCTGGFNAGLHSDISPHYFQQRTENNLVTNEQSKGDSNSQMCSPKRTG